MAPMAHVLWARFLRHNTGNPAWADRDRFILSAGYGSMLLYCLLHLTGYDLHLEELKLGKLILLYDDNRISIEGSKGLAFTEDRAAAPGEPLGDEELALPKKNLNRQIKEEIWPGTMIMTSALSAAVQPA